jgi:K+-transporting ATPase KdpF subunit
VQSAIWSVQIATFRALRTAAMFFRNSSRTCYLSLLRQWRHAGCFEKQPQFFQRECVLLNLPLTLRLRRAIGANRYGGSYILDSGFSFNRAGGLRSDIRLRGCLRLRVISAKGIAVFLTMLAAAVTLLLFVYLFAALLRPEWF